MLNLAHRSIDPQIMPRENFFGVDPLKHQKPAKREEHGVDDAVAEEWLTLKLRSTSKSATPLGHRSRTSPGPA